MTAEIIKPKFIVLDSNVFIADYWLRSPSFVLLRQFLSKTKATLVVPKIVFEEVVNDHKEEVDKFKSGASKLLRTADRIFRQFERPGWAEMISKAVANDPYPAFLSAILSEMKAQIPDYKDISHEKIVARDLARKRPFQESGKGYRDTLLWETVVRQCIRKDELTVLVTDNFQDFYNPDGELHPNLRRDVLARGYAFDSVALSRSLPVFTDTYIVPYLAERKDFATLVQHDKVPGLDLQEISERNMQILVEAVDDTPSVMIDDAGIYEPSVDVIEDISYFQVEQVSEIEKGILLVVYHFSATVSFTYFLPHSEYYSMPDEESAGIAILDHFWNEYVMRVEASTEIVVKCRLTFNSEKKEVQSFEVDEVTTE